MEVEDSTPDVTNLSTQKLVDLYGKYKHELTECKRKHTAIEKELLTREDTSQTCMDPELCSKLKACSNHLGPHTFRYYRPHSKRGTVNNITSFLSSYVEQLRTTQWDDNAIGNLSQGIGNYLWQRRVVRERSRIVFTRRKPP